MHDPKSLVGARPVRNEVVIKQKKKYSATIIYQGAKRNPKQGHGLHAFGGDINHKVIQVKQAGQDHYNSVGVGSIGIEYPGRLDKDEIYDVKSHTAEEDKAKDGLFVLACDQLEKKYELNEQEKVYYGPGVYVTLRS